MFNGGNQKRGVGGDESSTSKRWCRDECGKRVQQYHDMVTELRKELDRLKNRVEEEKQMASIANSEKVDAIHKLTCIRHAVTESIGKIEFVTKERSGQTCTVIKPYVGAKENMDLPVNMLTAALEATGHLGQLVRDLHELGDIPDDAFLHPGPQGGVAAATETTSSGLGGRTGSLIRDLQVLIDEGLFERREQEVRSKERDLASRQHSVAEREKMVEARYHALQQATEDEYVQAMKKERRRIQELYEDAHLEGARRAMEPPVNDHDLNDSGATEEAAAAAEEPFDGLIVSVDEGDVRDLVGEGEVTRYRGLSEYLDWLEY